MFAHNSFFLEVESWHLARNCQRIFVEFVLYIFLVRNALVQFEIEDRKELNPEHAVLIRAQLREVLRDVFVIRID